MQWICFKINYIIPYFSVIEGEPFHKFSIPIKSEGFDDGEGLACQLVFTYTAKYPDELPIIEIDNEENFDDVVDKDELLVYLSEQVNLFFFITDNLEVNILNIKFVKLIAG